MKKGIGVLFVFLFLLVGLTFVSAEKDCRFGATPYYGATATNKMVWNNNIVCTGDPCYVGASKYTKGDYVGPTVVLGVYIPRAYYICKESVISSAVCGNNVLENGESCDDGNTVNGDGCSSTCTVEVLTSQPTPTLCSSDQILFNLYRENNSHVSIYSDENYNVSVCYNELFGISYTGSSPQTCDSTNSNLIFWMNSTQNSHVSREQSAEFNTPLCYGNLNCRIIPDDCLGTEVLVAQLHDQENTHVSLSQDYDYNICCRNGLSIRDSYWSDLKGDQVESIDVGDSVLMVAKGFQFDIYENLNYTITGTQGNVKWWQKAFEWINFRGWEAPELWVTVDTDLWVSDIIGQFIFNVGLADTEGTTVSADSNILDVYGIESDSLPFVNITSNKTISTIVDLPVFFNATTYDKDDLLTLVWNYGDGASDTIEDYSLALADSISINSTHVFSQPGHYIVRLIASEKGRYQKVSDYVDVYVYDEEVNVIAEVSSPINLKTDYGQKIRFDASNSFILNCSYINFAASPVYRIFNPVTSKYLNCVYIQEPNALTKSGSYSLFVRWIIDEGKSSFQEVSGEWGSVVPSGVVQNFLNYFSQQDWHTAQLTLNYNSTS